MMYLYVGSIVAIMCIYISVLIDNCPSLTNSNGSRENLTTNKGDPEVGSIASFGTLRKAHIDRTKVSRTSFYLRVGALGKKLKNIWKILVWQCNHKWYRFSYQITLFKNFQQTIFYTIWQEISLSKHWINIFQTLYTTLAQRTFAWINKKKKTLH